MRFNNYLTDNIVFQRNESFLVSGFGKGLVKASLLDDAGKVVEEMSAQTKDGAFSFSFYGHKGSFKSYSLIAKDEEGSVEVSHVYFGEVLLFVGQSNLSYVLDAAENKDVILEKLKKQRVFALDIGENDVDSNGFIVRPKEPLKEISSKWSWKKAEGEVALSMSALSLMTGSLLADNFECPVGVVMTALGGISIDSLLPREAVESSPDIKGYLIKTKKYLATGESVSPSVNSYTVTSGVFDEKIAPLKGIRFKAVVFYQGENSAYDFESGRYFEKALTALISSYREHFGEEELPFIVSGITDETYPYGDGFGNFYIQEALSRVKGKNITFVPIFDIEPRWLVKDGRKFYHPIHSVNKLPVAERYSEALRRNVYGKEGFFYPFVKSFIKKDNGLLLEISYWKKGFIKGIEFFGFSLAGADGFYHSAKAVSVDNGHILLTSDVKNPKSYSYAFFPNSYYADCDTIDGYPLIQCRSELESFGTKEYLFNQLSFSADYLAFRENDFGPEFGSGFLRQFYTPGELITSPINIVIERNARLEGKGSILINANPTLSSYYFFSVKCLASYCGAPVHFERHKVLLLKLKGDSSVEFHGALYRVNGAIHKLSPITKKGLVQFVNISEEWEDYVLDLTHYLDGSEAVYPNTEKELSSLTTLELYFRGQGGLVSVLIDDLRLRDEVELKDVDIKKDDVDASIMLPPSQGEKK
jgi:sialate O-acetylesterase